MSGLNETQLAQISQDGDKIIEAIKREITDGEANELGRAVFAAVVWNDNAVAIINICNHKRAIGVHSLYGDNNHMLNLGRWIRTAREVEQELIKSGVKLNLVGNTGGNS